MIGKCYQRFRVNSNYIRGIIKANKRLIILIDIFKVIDQEMLNTVRKSVA